MLNAARAGIAYPPRAPRADFPVATLPGGKSVRYVFLTENPARTAEPRDTITVGGVPPTPPVGILPDCSHDS